MKTYSKNITQCYKLWLRSHHKRQLISFLVLICAIMVLNGCKKFIEIPPPSTQLVTSSIFKDNATATGAVLSIYSQMYNNQESVNMAINTGLLSDELTTYATGGNQLKYYENALLATDPASSGPWQNAYNYIYQVNQVIEGLQQSNGLSSKVKQQLSGESKFIRAFWYFYLTNCYGNIPIVTTTDYTKNSTISSSTQDLVYQQIIADLKDAQNLLSANFVDASDTTISTDRVRPTKWAATALLARAYLYTKDWKDAEIQASAVIGNTASFKLNSDLNSVFLANSTEAIFQLGIPLPANLNTWDGHTFILTSSPVGSSFTTSISPQLLNSFEQNDNRKTSWLGVYTTTDPPIQNYYFPYKYKVRQSTDLTEFTMVLRLAEQYLIRAEAEANGAPGDPIADLNVIRNRAGLPNYSGGSGAPLLAAILHERQVELFTEWGNRWFDLIRTNNLNAVMGTPDDVCLMKGGVWNPDHALFPIPQIEISKDHNLTQNTGY